MLFLFIVVNMDVINTTKLPVNSKRNPSHLKQKIAKTSTLKKFSFQTSCDARNKLKVEQIIFILCT